MDFVAFPMAMMGFIFGMIAFTQIPTLTKRVESLEQQLRDAGVIAKPNDES